MMTVVDWAAIAFGVDFMAFALIRHPRNND
jgi:hypothetical protein